MKTGKRFSVIFLVLMIAVLFLTFSACGEKNDSVSPITNVLISTLPKTDYYLGDSFDLGEAKLTVTHENGKQEVILLDASMVSNFNSSILGEQTLAVRYEDKTVYFTVTVSTPPVYSLSVNSTEHKTEYVVGEPLDVKNMTLLVTYSNGSKSTIPVSADMVSGFDSASAGDKLAVISYGGRTCTLDVTVVRRSIMQMQLTTKENKRLKTTYIVGDTIDFTNGYIFVSYNDESEEWLAISELLQSGVASVIVSNEDSTTLTKEQRPCTVTVYYAGREFSYDVIVNALKASTCAVTKDVAEQIAGAEDFDFSLGEITVTYNNGTVSVLDFYSEQVQLDTSACDLRAVGTYKISILVGGMTIPYSITVISPSPSELVLFPTATEFYQGDAIGVMNWKYGVRLNNGQMQRIAGALEFPVTEEMLIGSIDDIDTYKVGNQTLRFCVSATNGTQLSAEVVVTVRAKTIVDMQVINDGKKVYSEGDAFSTQDTHFVVTYNNGDVVRGIAISAEMLCADESGSPVDQNTFLLDAGEEGITEKVVFVHYVDPVFDAEYTASYTVLLVRKAVSVELMGTPQNKYVLGEPFIKDDLQIKITYSNGTTTTVTGENGGLDGSEWVFAFYPDGGAATLTGLAAVGRYTVVLTYGNDVHLSYVVTVTNDICDVTVCTAHLGFVTEGTAPDLTDVFLQVTRENGDKEFLPVTETMIGNYYATAYRPLDDTYVSAYVDSRKLAAMAFEQGTWETEYRTFFVEEENVYRQASAEYDVSNEYRINLAAMYADSWSVYKNYFYTDTMGTKAGAYDPEVVYYINNTKVLTISYEDKTDEVLVSVVGKTITSVAVQQYKSEYVKTDADWNVDGLEFLVRYSNGTSGLVSGTYAEGKTLLCSENDQLYYEIASLRYTMTIGVMDGDVFQELGFNAFRSALDTGADKMIVSDVVYRITDAMNGTFIYTTGVETFCMDKRVDSINVLVGDYDGTTFTSYDDQTIYLNEGNTLLVTETYTDTLTSEGFVKRDDSSRADVLQHVYLYVRGEGEDEYLTIEEARAASATSFFVSDYSQSTVHQVLTINYLRKTGTIGLEIRPNVINYLTVRVPTDGLKVIEKTAIEPDDVQVYVGYEDADGVLLTYEDENGDTQRYLKKIDFRQAICEGYSKNDDWDFGDNNTVAVTLHIGYGDYDYRENVPLTVKRKDLVSITLTTMPQLEYVEDPSGNTRISYVGGKVSLRFDNGTTKILDLTDVSVRKNAGTFDSKVREELTGGAQIQHTVYVSYNYAYYNNTKQTSYNVIIMDRKYVEIIYDESYGFERTLICEYGSSEVRFTLPQVKYSTGTGVNDVAYLERGAKDEVGQYYVQYRYPSGELKTEWPKAVGAYSVRITYFETTGDAYNNPFVDESVTIEITKKTLGISLDPFTATFGSIYEGDNETALSSQISWRMTDSVGLPENAYCEGDSDATVLDYVKFYIYREDDRVLLTEFVYQTQSVAVVTLPVGQYFVKPVVRLVSGSNYTLSSTVATTKASFTVVRRDIVVVADDMSKIYGTPDPTFTFRVYDKVDVVSAMATSDLSGVTATSIREKEGSGLKPIGNKDGVYFTYGGSNYMGNGVFDKTASTVAYTDTHTLGYHLTRSGNDNQNVGSDHSIYSGASEILSDFSVTYVSGNLSINKAVLLLTSDNLQKYFGTDRFDYRNSERDFGNKMGITFDVTTPMKNGDSFANLFAGYFEDDGLILYYNGDTGVYSDVVVGNCDDWVQIYKNVRIYTDAACTSPLGTYVYRSFTFGGETYEGYYSELPISLDAGTYYVIPDTTGLNLRNYTVSAKPYNDAAYSFTLTVKRVNAVINAKSYVISGNSMIRDQKNNAMEGKLLSAYFRGENIEVESVNKDTFDLELDSRFKNGIISVRYTDESGALIEYKLSINAINSEYSFVRGAEELHTGIHAVNVDNSGNNFSITLTSMYGENVIGETGKPYVMMFYDTWGKVYTSGSNTLQEIEANDYVNGSYVIVLPEFIALSYGNEMTGNPIDGYTFKHDSVYNKSALADFSLNSYISTNGLSYEAYTATNGISFAAVNEDTRYEFETMMVAGTYTATITYSFFDTLDKDYLFLGDSMLLRAEDIVHIINYLFDHTYMENAATKPLKYTESFTYVVNKIGLAVRVVTESCKYDEDVERSVEVEITEGSVCAGDELALSFNVDVTYNEKETVRYTGVEIGTYSIGGVNKSGGIGSLKVENAGVYEITVQSLGNDNYEIALDQNGLKSETGTFTVSPLVVPVYVEPQIGYDPLTPTTFTLEYTNSEDSSKTFLDKKWRKAADDLAFYSYRTNHCFVVKEYYGSYDENSHEVSDWARAELNFLPGNLEISAMQTTEDGEAYYPVNVNRDENGNVIGYPITFTVHNTEYVNYTVVFVRKVVYNYAEYYVEFDEGDGYELVIQPRTVRLYGFSSVNSKTYDGLPASVRSTSSALTLIGEVATDRIVKSGLTFTFTRTEESRKIGDVVYIRDDNNITDAGVFTVEARYIDSFGNQNYKIVFGNEEAQYDDGTGKDPSIGVYTIERGIAVLDLKHYSKSWMYKQYDGQGVVNEFGLTGTADSLNFSQQDAKPIDDYSSIYYKIVVSHYAAPTSMNNISYTDVTNVSLIGARSAIADPATFTYNVGYYWYTLRGMYYDEDSETYAEFADGEERKNWLSWNYVFEVKDPLNASVPYYTSDGIFFIYPRNIYLAINPEENAEGILSDYEVSTNMLTHISDAVFPLSTSSDIYVYSIVYDGYTYKKNVGISSSDIENGIFYSGNEYDLQADLNAGNAKGKFTYAFYVYDEDSASFVNSTRYNGLSVEVPASMFDLGSNAITNNVASARLSAGIDTFISSNPNYNVINVGAGHAFTFRITPRTINLQLALTEVTGSEYGDTQVVYGTTYSMPDGLVFRFTYADGEYDACGAIDANLADLASVINNIVNMSNSGYVNMIDRLDGDKSVLSNMTPKNVTKKTIDGVSYVYLTGSAIAALSANPYDDSNHILDRYSVVGIGLSSDETRYSIRVEGLPFFISRKEIVITGVERYYFDKDTDHYVLTVSETTGVNDALANEVLDEDFDDDGYILKDYLEDQTGIAADTGDWASGRYYIMIDSTRFRSDNPNFVVKTVQENPAWNINNWDGISVNQGTFVYLPLTIKKAIVSINYFVSDDVPYGNVIVGSDGSVDYSQAVSGLPRLQNATHTYTYVNHAKGTIVSEENVEFTGKTINGVPVSLQDEQEELKAAIAEVLLFAEIKGLIATTGVTGEQSQVAITNTYYSETPVFDNYEIAWGKIYYTIVKKPITISMSVSKGAYIVSGTTPNTYFSARWSERNDFYYADDIANADSATQLKDRRLGYTVDISDFSLNAEEYATLPKKIAAILGLSYVEDGGNWSVEYQGHTYSTTHALMSAILEYSIYVNRSPSTVNDPIATSGEILRYIAISGLESQNFSLNCARKEIMLYPEIEGIGLYTKEGANEGTVEYVNMIADTEAAKDGVTVSQDLSGNYIVNGLSMRIRYNFIGRNAENTIEYVDTKASSTADYTGMNYIRDLVVKYIPESSATDLTGGQELQNGDTITVQLLITETFYAETSYEYVNTIETNCFSIKMLEEGSLSTGYVKTVVDRTSGETLVKNGVTVEDLGSYLSDSAGLYYLNDSGNTQIEGMYDILNIRTKLVSLTEGASTEKFEIVVYENDFGTLLLGFTGTSAYVRMTYNHYYINAANNYESGASTMPIDATATYYRFASYSPYSYGPGSEQPSVLTPIPASPVYYEALGNGYMETSDTEFAYGKTYFVKTVATGMGSDIAATVSELFVNFNKSTIDVADTALFDGRNHSFGIYLDKVGSFTNISYQTNDSSWSGGVDDEVDTCDTSSVTINADRVLSLRVRVDELDYFFTYIGEPYIYEYTLSDYHYKNGVSETIREINMYTAQFFTVPGSTAINYTGLKVNVNKYTLQNRLIMTATSNKYIANVVFWPAGMENEEPYITNRSTAQAIATVLASIGNITISGGADAMAAYNARFTDELNVISVTQTTVDITGYDTSVSMTPGLYTITYNSNYNYLNNGENNSYTLSSKSIRVLIMDEREETVRLKKEGASDSLDLSSPQMLDEGYYFTGDIRTDMYGNAALTYVFDSVDIPSSGDIWFYFKLNNSAFKDFFTKNESLSAQGAYGIAFRIYREKENEIWVTRAQVVIARQLPIGNDESQYVCWSGTEKTITLASDASVINVLKIELQRISDNVDTGETVPVDNETGLRVWDDIVISFRLYQHANSATALVFEDYIREGFGIASGELTGGAISRMEIENNFFAAGMPHYCGLALNGASMRLLNMSTGISAVTNGDFVRYGKTGSYALNGLYIDNDVAIVSDPNDDYFYVLTDGYDVPYSYHGNTVNARFKASGATGGFRLYFGMNTPYWTDGDHDDCRRQRGLFLEYTTNSDELRLYYYKYDREFVYQTLLEHAGLMDGEEHELTVYIDFSVVNTQTASGLPAETYAARTFADGSECVGAYVPVSSNMSGIRDMTGNQKDDEEQNQDYMFLKGMYYLGFEVLGNASLTLMDYIAFQTSYSI